MAPDFQIFADSRIDISIMPALLQDAYTGKASSAFVSWPGGVGAPHVPIPLRGGARKQRRRPTRKTHRKAHRKTRRVQRSSRK